MNWEKKKYKTYEMHWSQIYNLNKEVKQDQIFEHWQHPNIKEGECPGGEDET